MHKPATRSVIAIALVAIILTAAIIALVSMTESSDHQNPYHGQSVGLADLNASTFGEWVGHFSLVLISLAGAIVWTVHRIINPPRLKRHRWVKHGH